MSAFLPKHLIQEKILSLIIDLMKDENTEVKIEIINGLKFIGKNFDYLKDTNIFTHIKNYIADS